MARHISNSNAFLQKELSEARLSLAKLKYIVQQSIDLVNASSKRDHLYAVAGDLIFQAPEEILNLEKTLSSASMAVNKMDQNELRQIVHPDRISELDKVLEDIRLHIPQGDGK